jgi:nucleoside phosphorylase
VTVTTSHVIAVLSLDHSLISPLTTSSSYLPLELSSIVLFSIPLLLLLTVPIKVHDAAQDSLCRRFVDHLPFARGRLPPRVIPPSSMSSRRLGAADFQLGILCALAHERTALLLSLDGRHLQVDAGVPLRNQFVAWDYGYIGNVNVIIGSLNDGEYGKGSAQKLCTHFVNAFGQHVRGVFFVGIAGGVPDIKHLYGDGDIRLGDVVISTSSIRQYDLGRSEQQDGGDDDLKVRPPASRASGEHGPSVQRESDDDVFTVREQVLPAPGELFRNLVSAWKADAPTRVEDPLAQHLSHLQQRLPDRTRGDFARPATRDVLYQSHVVHHHNTTCKGCTVHDDALVVRRGGRSTGNSPVVHCGVIGSADTLLKNAKKRDRLRREHKLLCVEMEAAGIAQHGSRMDYLVVRGICDYSDTHKNDNWHKYACMTAAAVARSLVFVFGQLLPAPAAIHEEHSLATTPAASSFSTLSAASSSLPSFVYPIRANGQNTHGPHYWINTLTAGTVTVSDLKIQIRTSQRSIGMLGGPSTLSCKMRSSNREWAESLIDVQLAYVEGTLMRRL